MDDKRNWKRYIGACGYHATVGVFIKEDEDDWTARICSFVNEMFPDEEQLDPSEENETVKSYRETFKILQYHLADSACGNLSVFDLEIAFEYVIPTSDPDKPFVSAKRADAILFGADRSVVFEFKTGQSEQFVEANKYDGVGQVNDYMRGLNNWHRFADGATIRGAVVVSALNNEFASADFPPAGLKASAILSPDRVAEYILASFKVDSRPVDNPAGWLRSFGTTDSPGEAIAREVSDSAAANFRSMRTLDGKEKAEIRKRLARRLGLSSTVPLKPLVAKLTGEDWKLRDAVVQLLESLPQSQLEMLFEEWRDSGFENMKEEAVNIDDWLSSIIQVK